MAEKLAKEETRTNELREKGASDKRVQKAEDRKKDVEGQLRAAGGKTEQSLGNQIRREEEHKRKARAAIDSAERRIAEERQQIQQLEAQIGAERELQQRHMQRCAVAEHRLAWLVVQKTKESLPGEYMERLRAAKGAMAAIGVNDESMAPVRELLAMLAPAAHDIDIDIAADDSSSSEAATEEWMGRGGAEQDSDLDEFQEEARGEVALAREQRERIQRQYQEALDHAFQNRPRAIKRGANGDELNQQDVDVDGGEEVAALDPEQMVDFYRERLRQEKLRVERIEELARKEKIPTQTGAKAREEQEGKEGNEAAGAKQQRQRDVPLRQQRPQQRLEHKQPQQQELQQQAIQSQQQQQMQHMQQQQQQQQQLQMQVFQR